MLYDHIWGFLDYTELVTAVERTCHIWKRLSRKKGIGWHCSTVKDTHKVMPSSIFLTNVNPNQLRAIRYINGSFRQLSHAVAVLHIWTSVLTIVLFSAIICSSVPMMVVIHRD
jgi:hypothetical protein